MVSRPCRHFHFTSHNKPLSLAIVSRSACASCAFPCETNPLSQVLTREVVSSLPQGVCFADQRDELVAVAGAVLAAAGRSNIEDVAERPVPPVGRVSQNHSESGNGGG